MAEMRGRALVVPIVMLVVAIVQGVRVVTLDQSTWQGAGFGMFATYDFDDTRGVAAIAVTNGTESLMPLDGISATLHRHARVVPSDPVLRRIGEVLIARAPAGTEAVRVEVRGPRLRGRVVHYTVVNHVTVDE